MTSRWLRVGTPLLGLATAWTVAPACAHHVMDGQLPRTFVQGFLSGLGHPVIGPDHLAIVIAIGIAAALVRAGATLIVTFVGASTVGVLVHLARIGLPMSEVLVALTIVAAGLMVAAGQTARNGTWVVLAVVAGLVHGYAFGESIVGAHTMVVGAYLLGLAVVMAVMALGVRSLALLWLAAGSPSALRLRVVGLALGALGVTVLAAGLVA